MKLGHRPLHLVQQTRDFAVPNATSYQALAGSGQCSDRHSNSNRNSRSEEITSRAVHWSLCVHSRVQFFMSFNDVIYKHISSKNLHQCQRMLS